MNKLFLMVVVALIISITCLLNFESAKAQILGRDQEPAITSATWTQLSGMANQIIPISWSSNLGEFGIAKGTSTWRSGRIPFAIGDNVVRVTATDASNSSVANPLI